MADGPLYPGSGGIEPGRQLGIKAVYWDIYGIKVLIFIGLFSL